MPSPGRSRIRCAPRRKTVPHAKTRMQRHMAVLLDDLRPALRVGVFAQPRTFPAWIRFSNGSGTPQQDPIGDGRGTAIKLMGVAQSASTTQDFVMINYPAFFVRNAADYVDFQSASNPLRFFFPGLNPFHFRLAELTIARAIIAQSVLNPLNVRYWSMTAYCENLLSPPGIASTRTARSAGSTGCGVSYMRRYRACATI
jgi:hypothetical protein